MERVYLNVGCGNVKLPGFVNLDRDPTGDVVADAERGLPFADGSLDGIFSEHFLEHLEQAAGVAHLRECRRVLAPGGVLRIAMPDLDGVVRDYCSADWLHPDWERFGYTWLQNRCEMLNLALREWGHKWLYNEEELVRLGTLAGLTPLARCSHGAGSDPHLAGREYREGSRLIYEFRKERRPHPAGPPLVSILIPAFNPTHFRAALESALDQRYPELEILVGDDCPGEQIAALVREYAARDGRIRYLRNAPALGEPLNDDMLFRCARGEYLKFLNDDDLLEPGCVERMAACLAALPDVTLVTAHRRLIDEHGRRLPDGEIARRPFAEDAIVDGVWAAATMLERGVNFIGEPSSVMFRKADLAGHGPILPSFCGRGVPHNGDVALFLNLLSRGDLLYLQETQSAFRIHPAQTQRGPEMTERGRVAWEQLRFDGRRMGLDRRFLPEQVRHLPLEAKPWWPAAALRLVDAAAASAAAGRVEEAERTLGRALAFVPDDPWLATTHAGILSSLGRDVEAVESLARATAWRPESVAIHAAAAALYEKQGDLEAALHHAQIAQSLAPSLV